MPSSRPATYSPKEVMYCYYHPHLTSGDGFVPEIKKIPSDESKVHIKVFSVLWGNRLPILDGSLPLFRYYDSEGDILFFKQLLNEDTSSDVSPALLPAKSSSLVLPLPDPRIPYDLEDIRACFQSSNHAVSDHFDPFLEIPSDKSKVHIEVLSVLWGSRLPIPDGSLPLSR
ncbi:hypothetical protein Tco_0652760 [Tanacetum coccineum]|uniref:Uncharacterized protein n=1 Tax=Tanacetum coccineum TaxID=301880 RepID=A0ABQ4WZ84_9ASTR